MHRIKSRDEWTHLVQRCRELGVSRKSFCDQEGLKLPTFSYWHRKLTEAEETTITCVELPLSNSGTRISDEVLDIQIQSDEIRIPLSSHGADVKIQGSISLAHLVRIVRACSRENDVQN